MISIVVPIYNVGKYLDKCIDSIINQDYKDIEIILVDDGSSDESLSICNEYAKKDGRIIVIHQENKGVSSARNRGLDIANGEYIGFVDPDDFIDVNMFSCMNEAIVKDEADLCICGYNYYDENYDIDEKRIYKEKENEIIDLKELYSRFFDMPPTVRHGVVNKLFKRSIIDSLRFDENLHSAEDVKFLNEYAKRIKLISIVNKGLYKNLIRQGSATHGSLNIEKLSKSFDAHNEMHSTAVSLFPELFNKSMAFLLDTCYLKYNEAVNKYKNSDKDIQVKSKPLLKNMKSFIKKTAIRAVFDREIYWKTRIKYLIF